MSELAEAIAQRFPELGDPTLVPLAAPAGGYALAAHVAEAANPAALARALTAFGADRDVVLLPVLYPPDVWRALSDTAGDWLANLAHAPTRALIPAAYATRGGDTDHLRDQLLAAVRRYHALLDALRRCELRAGHLSLATAHLLVGDALALLFATRGATFSGEADAAGRFAEIFADAPTLGRDDVLLYFEIGGHLAQARLAFHTLGPPESLPIDWDDLVRRIRELLHRVADHARRQLATTAYRRRRRIGAWLIAAGALAGAILVAVVLWP